MELQLIELLALKILAIMMSLIPLFFQDGKLYFNKINHIRLVKAGVIQAKNKAEKGITIKKAKRKNESDSDDDLEY